MTSYEQAVTPRELLGMMAIAGKAISLDAIQYHCRDPRGVFYGRARKIGQSWQIPIGDAKAFVETWTPYSSMRRK